MRPWTRPGIARAACLSSPAAPWQLLAEANPWGELRLPSGTLIVSRRAHDDDEFDRKENYQSSPVGMPSGNLSRIGSSSSELTGIPFSPSLTSFLDDAVPTGPRASRCSLRPAVATIRLAHLPLMKAEAGSTPPALPAHCCVSLLSRPAQTTRKLPRTSLPQGQHPARYLARPLRTRQNEKASARSQRQRQQCKHRHGPPNCRSATQGNKTSHGSGPNRSAQSGPPRRESRAASGMR